MVHAYGQEFRFRQSGNYVQRILRLIEVEYHADNSSRARVAVQPSERVVAYAELQLLNILRGIRIFDPYKASQQADILEGKGIASPK